MRKRTFVWGALGAVALTLVGCAGAQKTDPPPSAQVQAPTPAPQEPAFSDVTEPEDAPVDALGQALESEITQVTVYSDRALVTREARASVKPDPQVFLFKNLPGWVDDGSVRVAASAGRIVDVRVQRDYLARATDATWLKAEDAHQALLRKKAALQDELTILDAQKAQIEDIKLFSLEKLSQDGATRDIKIDTYGGVVRFISQSLRETAQARRDTVAKLEALNPEILASQRELQELQNLMKLEETTVMVTLQSTQAVDSELKLTYMTPGATWEPLHELRVSSAKPEEAELTSFAVVTQTTGEDWTGAQLSFSTQSSTETVRIPELEALTLGDTATATRTITKQISSFSRAQKAFEGQNAVWNKRRQKGWSGERFEEMYQSNYNYLQVVQSKTVQIFQSLQQRGTTVHFKGDKQASVRSDGRSVRLRIGQGRPRASQQIVAAPEQSLNAALTLEMTNTSKQPLLPGQVALYRDGAFLGMTELEFVADGEKFALFLSVADQLKIERRLNRKQSALVRSKRNRMQLAFEVVVENLSDAPTSLVLADRVPVSENKDIRVSNIAVEPRVKPDEKGLLQWSLTLAPKERRAFTVSYQVEYPPTLILETQRRRSNRPAPRPGSAAPSKNYDIQEQILDLEQNF